MTVTSIIDVDVKDEKFKAFYDLFSDYHKKLEGMPEDWEAVGKSGKGMYAGFAALFGQMSGMSNNTARMVKELQKATKAQKEFHVATRQSANSMNGMLKDAKQLSSTIFGIGKFLFKMGALGVGMATAGVYGLDRLGQSAVSGQRNARGLNMSQGQVNAFGVNFSRYVDPSMLTTIANQQSSFAGRVHLSMATGWSPSEVANKTPDELAIQAMRKGKEWMAGPGQHTEETARAKGFGDIGLSMEKLRILSNTPGSQFEKDVSQYKRDIPGMNISNGATGAWYELTSQVQRAGKEIDTFLTERLQKLGPALSDAIRSLTRDFEGFVNNITPDQITAFANGIKDIATYLGSEDALNKIKAFGDAVGVVTRFILKIGGVATSDNLGSQIDSALSEQRIAIEGRSVGMASSHAVPLNTGSLNVRQLRKKQQLDALDIQMGRPVGTSAAIAFRESSLGMNNQNQTPGSTSAGIFGQTKAFRDYWGVKDTSEEEETKGLNRFMTYALKKYNGDLKKALAEYHEGPGAMREDLERAKKAGHPENWIDYTRGDTKQYLSKYIITVENRTGSDVSVSAAAAGR